MPVDNIETIDFISVNTNNKVVLTISDHLKWNDKEHLNILQDKINAYLEVIENDEIYELYPDAIDKDFVIEVSMKYSPNKVSTAFLNDIKGFLADNGYEFNFYKLD